MRFTRMIAAAITMAGLVLGTSAQAAYPEKPISMIVAYAPGGGTDLTARVIAPFIEKYLGGGAKVVVVNRPGAGGEIGFTALADAAPDGYTIGFINTPNILSIPLERKTGYSLVSFEPLGNVVDDPGGFSVHNASEIKSLAELVAYAKANPNAVTVGTTGVGSDDHLSMLTFQKITGVKMTHVPFPGAAAVRTALVGRHITLGAVNIGEAMQFVQSGSPFRNLGQMSEKRSDIAPDVPTFKEQGFDMEFASLRGIAAPKGLSAEIRERLVAAVAKAVADPEFQAKAKEIYAPIRFLAPEEYAATLRRTEEELRAIWKETPWSAK
jgi:tripartite-type tricarboxylate transporter receptor subunit TctC